MAKSKKDNKSTSSTIVLNKKARHDFTLEDRFEAGIVLEGKVGQAHGAFLVAMPEKRLAAT